MPCQLRSYPEQQTAEEVSPLISVEQPDVVNGLHVPFAAAVARSWFAIFQLYMR